MNPKLEDLRPVPGTLASMRHTQLSNEPFINARNLAVLFYKKGPDGPPLLTFQETLDNRPGVIDTIIRHEIALGVVIDDSANQAAQAAMNGVQMQPPSPNGPPQGVPQMAAPLGVPQGTPAMAPQPGAPAPVSLGGQPQAQPEPAAPSGRGKRRGAGVAPPHAPSAIPSPQNSQQGQPMNYPANNGFPAGQQTYGTPGAPPPAGNNFGPPPGAGGFGPPPGGQNFGPPPGGQQNFGPPPGNAPQNFGPPPGASPQNAAPQNFGPPPNTQAGNQGQSFAPPSAPTGGQQNFAPAFTGGGQNFAPAAGPLPNQTAAPAPVTVDFSPLLNSLDDLHKKIGSLEAELTSTKLLALHALTALHHVYMTTPALADGAGKSGLPVQNMNGFRQFLDGYLARPQG